MLYWLTGKLMEVGGLVELRNRIPFAERDSDSARVDRVRKALKRHDRADDPADTGLV